MPSNQSVSSASEDDIDFPDITSPSQALKTRLQEPEEPSNDDDISAEVAISRLSKKYPGKTSIFLGPISPTTTEYLLHFYLQDSEYGEISSVHIPNRKYYSKGKGGRKGGPFLFAIVTFCWHEDAAAAMHRLNGIVMDGMELHPQWSLPAVVDSVEESEAPLVAAADDAEVVQTPSVSSSHCDDVVVVPTTTGSSYYENQQHHCCRPPSSKKRGRPETNQQHISLKMGLKGKSEQLLLFKKSKTRIKIATQSKQMAVRYQKEIGGGVY